MNVNTEEQELYQYDKEFRDTLATVDKEGKRVWVFPKKPSGRFHRARIAVSLFLLAIFFSIPWIELHDRPLMLFNIFERRFILFGNVFWPQDFFLLAITLIVFFVFVTLFTVAFGRIWCGWACPQTLFLEMVFRKLEYWIEGDSSAQRRLKNAPWNGEKIFKKGSKHFIYLLISVLISHTAMAYLIGIDEVKTIVTESPLDRMAGFIGLVFFTGLFYMVFAWFREQACIAVCPYGRLQGVLLGKNSLVVIYDWLRGEKRGKIKKSQERVEGIGDCIDCKLCVYVCPTGIDIRNGTQLECVNCTACIDACDEVMEKVKRPKGLIRYSSLNSIEQGAHRIFTPRIAAYTVVLVLLVSLLVGFISTRKDVQTTVLKAPGTLFSRTEDGQISNLYNVEFVNKTFEDMPITIKIESPPEAVLVKVGEQNIVIPHDGLLNGIFLVKIPEEKISTTHTTIEFGIYHQGALINTVKAKFIGPIRGVNPSEKK